MWDDRPGMGTVRQLYVFASFVTSQLGWWHGLKRFFSRRARQRFNNEVQVLKDALQGAIEWLEDSEESDDVVEELSQAIDYAGNVLQRVQQLKGGPTGGRRQQNTADQAVRHLQG